MSQFATMLATPGSGLAQGDTPSVFVNTTDRPLRVWTNLPPHSFFVLPAADGPVAVAWSSPISGTVTMTMRIADAHPGGPDGVAWRLELVGNDMSGLLRAQGELATTRQAISRERALLVARQPRNEVAYAVTEGTPGDARLQLRGDPEKPGPVVPRRWLEVLGGHAVPPGSGSGRRQLARWLTAAENPLAARVMVNRIWQFHFGKGLVTTPNDFGSRGQRADQSRPARLAGGRVRRVGLAVEARAPPDHAFRCVSTSERGNVVSGA